MLYANYHRKGELVLLRNVPGNWTKSVSDFFLSESILTCIRKTELKFSPIMTKKYDLREASFFTTRGAPGIGLKFIKMNCPPPNKPN